LFARYDGRFGKAFLPTIGICFI